jgi:hypothetical protein
LDVFECGSNAVLLWPTVKYTALGVAVFGSATRRVILGPTSAPRSQNNPARKSAAILGKIDTVWKNRHEKIPDLLHGQPTILEICQNLKKQSESRKIFRGQICKISCRGA